MKDPLLEQSDEASWQSQVQTLRQALRVTEQSLEQCQQKSSNVIHPNINVTYSALEEFLSIFTKQYVGVIVGVVFSLIFRFFDHAIALRIAKKYNIKQKTIMQAAFPTLICFLQYLLRKRSKDSKLAALLSLLKRNNSVNNNNINSVPQTKPKTDSSQQTSKNNPRRRSSYTTPQPLSSFSSVDTDCDSVFFSDQTETSQTYKTKTKSVVAKYKKTSQVSIKMSPSPKKK